MARKTLSRPFLTAAAVVVVGGVLALAFWPRAVMVDIGAVTRGEMMVTIDEEGRTRVRNAYVVSTPVEGRLLRVTLEPGDKVTADATVIARMRPRNPAALDVRTREQARAAVAAAEAALNVAKADLEAADADLSLADSDLERTSQLARSGTASQAALDRARSAATAAEARRHTALAAIEQRQAELTNAQAQLIGFDDRGLLMALEDQLGDEIPIYAPIDGRVLRVIQQDETTLHAGSPIVEIGDIGADLEITVELISTDAVQVREGNAVIVEDWGGPEALTGFVERIEPFGVTKTSALGVEEQRVTVVVRIGSPPEQHAGLGHGYRVETRVVIWQENDIVIVPTSALFRQGGAWAVLAVANGRARLKTVGIGRDNGLEAQVLKGLEPGDRVVLYPPASLSDGGKVAERAVE